MNGVEDVIQSSWGANLQNVPIATAVLSDSGRSKAAMSAKRQPHTDELSKVPSHGLRDVATTTLRQLRPQSRETRLFVLQY